jgi:hypothetical protein
LLRRLALALLTSLALVVVFAVLLTRAGNVRLAAHLERLSHNSPDIGRLDFEAVRCLHSSVSEIQQLASST